MKRIVVVFSAVLLAVCAAIAGLMYLEVIDAPTFGHTGRIVVNSPSVYTRQRLVNDRLTQSAWLQEQLKITEGTRSAEFRAVDEIQLRAESRAARAGVSGRTGGAGGIRAPSPGAQETGTAVLLASSDGQTDSGQPGSRSARLDALAPPTAPAVTPVYKLEQTTAERFRAMNNYREEVRSEMMQTLLDDRHDIQGNTIYRLSVDASVVAGTRKSDLAIVDVQLKHDPNTDAEIKTDYGLLYDDWLRYVQKAVSSSVDLVAKSLTVREPEPTQRRVFPDFLRFNICTLMQPEPGDEGCNDPAGPRYRSASRLLARYTELFVRTRMQIVRARFLHDLKPVAAALSAEVDDEDQAFEAAYRDCREKRPRQGGDAPQTTVTGRAKRAGTEKGTPAASANTQSSTSSAPSVEQSILISCPLWTSPMEGIIGGAELLDLLRTRRDVVQSRFLDEPSLEREAERLYGLARSASCGTPGQDLAACVLPDLSLAQHRCLAADYIQWSLRSSTEITTLLDMQTTGRDVGDCNVAVRGTRSGSSEDRKASVDKLRTKLNEVNEVFAYSVTPRNLAQRISTVLDTREALDLVTRLQAGAGLGTEGDVEASRRRAEQLQAVLNHAIVVPFGHSPSSAQPTRHPPYATQFGWAIAPRLKGSQEPEHIDGQYSLAAVISVPGWWRSVQLSIRTCWASRRKLKPAVKAGTAAAPAMIDLCAGEPETHSHIVRLPGMISEVSRKLGFEIVEQPNLMPEQLPQTLQVGYAGDVVLTGGRLWRSTEVTLGSQKADRITVLPNMEGIIASFTCVRPQGGWQGLGRTPPQPAVVRVWTSEGVTSLEGEWVTLEYPGTARARGAKPCEDEGAPEKARPRP